MSRKDVAKMHYSLTVSLPAWLLVAVNQEARDRGETVSFVIREALRRYLGDRSDV